MTTKRVSLDADEYEDTEALSAVFLEGECYAFAVALQRLTGFEMVALKTEAHPTRHAAVRDQAGRLYDARGFVSEAAFGIPFGVSPPYDLWVVTLEELRAIRPVHDYTIERAEMFIETTRPELVRFPTVRTRQIIAFLDGLEVLSRQHGLWIRSRLPMVPPYLAEAYGDEAGCSWKTNAFGSAPTLTVSILPKETPS